MRAEQVITLIYHFLQYNNYLRKKAMTYLYDRYGIRTYKN